jgi:hypothetical protein
MTAIHFRTMILAATLLTIGPGLAGTALAQSDFTIRGSATGNWADRAFSKQGVQIEVVNKDTAVVAWFTYGTMGQPLWLFGVGNFEGSEIQAEMLLWENGIFPGRGPQEQEPQEARWGDLVIDFADCNSARMSWESSFPGFPDGSIDLVRVTAIEGLSCGARERFEREVRFNLDAAPGQWDVLFSDYPVFQEDQVEKTFEWTQLPEPLSDRHGLQVGGTNRSDDLAMQLETMIGGLEPSTEYEVVQELTFATDVPTGCVGVGGSPGEAVYMHLGAAPIEPIVEQVFDPDNNQDRFVMNVGKANMAFPGEDAIAVGDMANSQDCEDFPPGEDRPWELKTVSSAGRGFTARTDDQGRLWVFGGSDSGFEDRTTYYVTDWLVRLRPSDAPAR